MILRKGYIKSIEKALSRSRVTILSGPRQCGKTTLARHFLSQESPNYFDLEDPISLARLDEPMTALSGLKGLIVIDEIQRRPELFPVLRVLSDRKPLNATFLILGSALRQSSESLAGRMEIITMTGFNLAEIGVGNQEHHWLRGGFPLSYLAESDENSHAWRKNFLMAVVERDIPQIRSGIPSKVLFRFWTMIAHFHGQIWNAAPFARSMGVSAPTVRRYLDLLEGIFMVRQLQPWYANIKKRQVKAPKVYIRDSGLLHTFLGIGTQGNLLTHPSCGASWEGYVIEEALRAIQPEEAYFWATHNGAELDLFLVKNRKRLGLDVKRADAPRLTPSMRRAMTDLQLDKLWVIYPGDRRYSLAAGVDVLPLKNLLEINTLS
ncbi:MAG: ATP-binding protein [Proteobacteria bacterium]|nr:ATP-binding protein [Pseudomonadota bacterium]